MDQRILGKGRSLGFNGVPWILLTFGTQGYVVDEREGAQVVKCLPIQVQLGNTHFKEKAETEEEKCLKTGKTAYPNELRSYWKVR